MKKIFLALALLGLSSVAIADRFDKAASKNSGNYIESYAVSVSSFTATKIIDETIAIKSANIDIFPNSAFDLFIGTNTSTLLTTGFPILSSTTFTLDGTYTGSMYAITEGAANANVRVIYYLKNDWAN